MKSIKNQPIVYEWINAMNSVIPVPLLLALVMFLCSLLNTSIARAVGGYDPQYAETLIQRGKYETAASYLLNAYEDNPNAPQLKSQIERVARIIKREKLLNTPDILQEKSVGPLAQGGGGWTLRDSLIALATIAGGAYALASKKLTELDASNVRQLQESGRPWKLTQDWSRWQRRLASDDQFRENEMGCANGHFFRVEEEVASSGNQHYFMRDAGEILLPRHYDSLDRLAEAECNHNGRGSRWSGR